METELGWSDGAEETRCIKCLTSLGLHVNDTLVLVQLLGTFQTEHSMALASFPPGAYLLARLAQNLRNQISMSCRVAVTWFL